MAEIKHVDRGQQRTIESLLIKSQVFFEENFKKSDLIF